HIVAIGTTVVLALESAADVDGSVRSGRGVAKGRIGRETPLGVVDSILTGVHQPGDSHFELLRAFASDALLDEVSEAFRLHNYHPHDLGDSLLIEQQRQRGRQLIGPDERAFTAQDQSGPPSLRAGATNAGHRGPKAVFGCRRYINLGGGTARKSLISTLAES